jgi:hypothetical protein
MLPPAPNQDSGFAAFLRYAAENIEASWRAHGLTMPLGVSELLCRVAFEHLGNNPHPLKTSWDSSMSRLVTIVQELESELPGGRTNAGFTDMLAGRIRDAMAQRGGG